MAGDVGRNIKETLRVPVDGAVRISSVWFGDQRMIECDFAGGVGAAEGGEFTAVGKIGKGEKDFFRIREMACIEELFCMIIFFKKESVRRVGKDGGLF